MKYNLLYFGIIVALSAVVYAIFSNRYTSEGFTTLPPGETLIGNFMGFKGFSGVSDKECYRGGMCGLNSDVNTMFDKIMVSSVGFSDRTPLNSAIENIKSLLSNNTITLHIREERSGILYASMQLKDINIIVEPPPAGAHPEYSTMYPPRVSLVYDKPIMNKDPSVISSLEKMWSTNTEVAKRTLVSKYFFSLSYSVSPKISSTLPPGETLIGVYEGVTSMSCSLGQMCKLSTDINTMFDKFQIIATDKLGNNVQTNIENMRMKAADNIVSLHIRDNTYGILYATAKFISSSTSYRSEDIELNYEKQYLS